MDLKKQFDDWLERKSRDGLNFNETLLSKRDFHNPSLATKLLEYAGLRECSGTHLPSIVYNPSGIPSFDYERIAVIQKKEWEESGKMHSSVNRKHNK